MLIIKFWTSAYFAAALYNWMFFRYTNRQVFGKSIPIRWGEIRWFLKSLTHPVNVFKLFFCNMMIPDRLIANAKRNEMARRRRMAWARAINTKN